MCSISTSANLFPLAVVGVAGLATRDILTVSVCSKSDQPLSIQSPKKVFVRGFVNFVLAVAYLFCLNLPAVLYQPRTKTFFGLCK